MSTPTAPGSTGYGVDIYGTILYGRSQERSLSVEPVLISQTDYGRLSLSWQSPNEESWRRLRLVRNTDGFPSHPDDGTVVLETTVEAVRTSFDDIGLAQGYIYYYSVFMSQEAPEWDNTPPTEYPVGAIVTNDGAYWLCISEGNSGHEPVVGSGFWVATTYKPIWYPAGNAAALAIKDQGYSIRLYDRSPQPYKTVTSDLFANVSVDNPYFLKYLSLFGFALNDMKTEYDNLLLVNDTDFVSAANLDKLGAQFGLTTDYISSPRLRRSRVRNVSVNYRLKGTEQGLYNAIASVTGWKSDISTGHNLMLSPDQAMFESRKYPEWRQNYAYFVNDFVTYNGYQYKNILDSQSNPPTGTGTSNVNWEVQLNVVDNVTLRNPSTQGISTWGNGFFGPAGTYTPEFTQLHGVVNPLNASDNSVNAMGYRVTSGTPLANANVGVTSSIRISTPAWSALNNYVVGNYVDIASVTAYRALKPSGPGTIYGPITPGTNAAFWDAETQFIGVTYGNGQYYKDAVPLPQVRYWNSVFLFAEGEEAQLNGRIYIALSDNVNKTPTGTYASNVYWQYDRVAEQAYTASHYSRRLVSASNVQAGSVITWFDKDGGELFDTRRPATPTQYAQFDTDYPNLNGNTDNLLALPWVGVPAATTLWESVYGQARVNPEQFQALGSKPKYTYIHLADTRDSGVLAFTFGLDYEDNVNFEHGVMFRRTGTNFWFLTRTRLVLYNGGVETVKATWSPVKDWDRIRVTITSTRILVEKYFRPGTANTLILLADVNDATLGTPVSGYGIIQRYALGV